MKAANLSRATICILCAILQWRYAAPFEETEFRGGTVTGPVLQMSDVGTILFVVAVPLAFLSRNRIWGANALLASLLCLPLYLYSTLPGPFRCVFRGEYKVALKASVVWDAWSVIGVVAVGTAAALGMRSLLSRRQTFPIRSSRGR